ncbi:MAG: hypothetical protein RLZZ293_184 [Pseudomonadota bacterium]
MYSIYTNFNGIHEESGFLEIKGNLSTNGKQFTQSLADNIVYNPDTSSQIWVSFDQLEFKVKPDNTITGSMYFLFGAYVTNIELIGKYDPVNNSYSLRQLDSDPDYHWEFTVVPQEVKPLASTISGTAMLPFNRK